MICGNTLRGSPRWCFMLLWCVVSIGISCYWRGYNIASGLRRYVILNTLNQRMPCASNQVLLICLWMPRCVHLVLVLGLSYILVLMILDILISSVWVSCAVLMDFYIAMLRYFSCSLQLYIYRHLTIVSLLVWQILCFRLGHPWWWHIVGI